MLVQDNRVHENANRGMEIGGTGAEAVGNRSYLNGEEGLVLWGAGAKASRNVVYSNGYDGIYTYATAGEEIRNNLAYDNGTRGSGYNLNASHYDYYCGGYCHDTRAVIENNTLYGGNGLLIGNPVAVTNRNNIIWASGVGKVAVRIAVLPGTGSALISDYNDLYATDGATVGDWRGTQRELADWQYITGRDGQSFSTDPDFVNTAGADATLGGTNGWDDNFHLASTAGSYTGLPFTAPGGGSFAANGSDSVCVDAGNPSMSIGAESSPHGGRINLGAFGGTADASRSEGVRVAVLDSVDGGEVLRGSKRITWHTRGPWTTGDTVLLEYSPDGGLNWYTIPGADAVAFEQGWFDWSMAALTPGTNYLIRLSRNGGGGARSPAARCKSSRRAQQRSTSTTTIRPTTCTARRWATTPTAGSVPIVRRRRSSGCCGTSRWCRAIW